MAEKSKKDDSQSRIRSTALKHALNIEEKKKLKAHVADLVLQAYDLPSVADADPANPTAADVALFRQCLNLFQPSDLDDLIQERNIDGRCGYALCPRPNRKVAGGGDKVWNQKGGKDFKIVDRIEMERWCSQICGKRAAFLSAQLSPEPSWVRENPTEVQFVEEIGRIDDFAGAVKTLAGSGVDEEVTEKLKALSLERGEHPTRVEPDEVAIVERSTSEVQAAPPSRGEQLVEGYRPRKVHFAQDQTSITRAR